MPTWGRPAALKSRKGSPRGIRRQPKCTRQWPTRVGDVDATALTGSLVYSKVLLDSIIRKISFIAPVHLNPGENEMEALADVAMRYFNKEEALSVSE